MPASRPVDTALAKALYHARSVKAEHRLNEAIELYKKILASHPENAEALGNLGHTAGMIGNVARGIDLVRRAIELDPGSAELHHHLAALLAFEIKPEEALESLGRCLEIEPRRVGALTLAAQCCDRLNRLAEARAFAERAIAAKRTDPEANLVLAQLDSKAKRYAEARERLEKLVGRSSTPPETHHRVLTELGVVLDKLGEFDAAYEAFERAGAGVEALPITRSVSRTLAFDRIAAYRGRVTRELVGRFSGETFETPAPAFLVGFPRSGTTMTEQVLAAHPGVVTSDEHQLMDPLGRRLMEGATGRLDVPGALARLDKARVEELRRVYWDEVARQIPEATDGRLFIDKLPLNIIDLPMINAIFPDARVLVALRDPRDCCLSCFMQWFRPNPAMVHMLHLESTVRLYEAVMGLYLEFRGELTVPVLQIRYEDTVSDLEAQARRLVDHFGLPWHVGLLTFHEKARERTIRTPSYVAVTEKVNTKAIGRWRNYARFYEPLLPMLAPFVAEFGYGAGEGT